MLSLLHISQQILIIHNQMNEINSFVQISIIVLKQGAKPEKKIIKTLV